MRNKLNKLKFGNFVFIIIVFLLIIQLTSIKSQNNETVSEYDLALKSLNQSRIDIQEMMNSNFGVLRVNDTLNRIEQLFEAQFALQEKGAIPDYFLVIEGAKEIAEIKKTAEETFDELNALESGLEDISKESEVYTLFNEAKIEFKDERYGKVTELVEEAYIKIDEEKSVQAKVGVVYTASTKTIFGFLKRNWKILTFTIIFITLFYLIFRKKIAIFLIDRKINELNFEKGVLKNLIEKTQYEYFHLFKIPEELYQIRIEKFGELIRDMDRQIPLLLERKEKIKRGGEQFVNEEERKTDKKLTIFSIFLIILVSIIIIPITLAIYFKKISYDEFLLFIQSPWSIYIIIFILIFVLLIILVFIHLLKKQKGFETQKKQKIFEEKRPKFLQFFLNKINSIKLYIQRLKERIREKKEYSRLLKEKKREEGSVEEYLKQKKTNSIKEKIKEILFSPYFIIKKVSSNWKELNKQERREIEGRRILEELQKRDKKSVIPNTLEKTVNKKEEVLKNLKKLSEKSFSYQTPKEPLKNAAEILAKTTEKSEGVKPVQQKSVETPKAEGTKKEASPQETTREKLENQKESKI